MKRGRKQLLFAIPLLIFISCGPPYKIGDSKIKRISNIHDITVIKRSRLNYEVIKQRKKEQKKVNKERWKKQMKNQYKN